MVDNALVPVVRERGYWRNYVTLFRFPYHSSFIGVFMGEMVVTRHWSQPLVWRMFLVYLSMNVLLYGGLYTLNAITDSDADSRHPVKRHRPVASGAISQKSAGLFAAGLIIGGFLTGLAWFGLDVIPIYLLFLGLNVFYSLLFRNLFLLDILFNAATHPPRFWLGMWLAGGQPAWELLALVFLFSIGLASCRRSILLSYRLWESGGSRAQYSKSNLLAIQGLTFCAIVLLWVLSGSRIQIPYLVTVCAYVVFVGGIEFVPALRSRFEKLWLR
jgi:4-hydroxybenzoate polyprenyltransferase